MTTHYTSRPLLASDAPHVARIDAMQSENPMGAEQIRKLVSRQHIGGLVVENSEGVIVAWCMHLRCHGVLDVVRFQRHIEFDCGMAVVMMANYLLGRSVSRIIVSVHEPPVETVLGCYGFKNSSDSSDSCVIMEYTP
jgi:hypothetical protein